MAVADTTSGFAIIAIIALLVSPRIVERVTLPPPLIHLFIGLGLALFWPLLPVAISNSGYALSDWAAFIRTGLGLVIVYAAGLTLPLSHLKDKFTAIARTAAVKLIPPLVVLPLICLMLWPGAGDGALVVGIALSEVSVAISWGMLHAHDRLHSEAGRNLIGVTFLVNSAVVIAVILVLHDLRVGLTLIAFIAGISSHGRLSKTISSAFEWCRDKFVVPLFFVAAGSMVDWMAGVREGFVALLVLLIVAELVRMPIPGLSSHRLLGISKQDGRYTDALASGRLTFAVLILGLGSAAGIVNDSMLSSATLVVALLAAISALLAHRLHNSESTKRTEDH